MSDGAWVHPLDQEEVKSFLKDRLASAIYSGLEKATRPIQSPSPSFEEMREVEEMKNLHGRYHDEDIGSWVLRVLYHETFGIILGTGNLLTFGGAITHYWKNYKVYGEGMISPQTILDRMSQLEIDIASLSLDQMLTRIHEAAKSNKLTGFQLDVLLTGLIKIGIPTNHKQYGIETDIYRAVANKQQDPIKLLEGWQAEFVKKSWLILKLAYWYRQELVATYADERLKEFNIPSGLSHVQALLEIWKVLGKQDGLIWKGQEEEGIRDSTDALFDGGLRQLAIVRTSPDFTFLYTFFCAEGAISAKKTSSSQT